MEIGFGLTAESRLLAAKLLWEAFSGKLQRPLGEVERAQEFLAATLDPETTALTWGDEELLGAVVLTDAEHRSSSDDWEVAREIYGTVGAARRLALLAPLETTPPAGCLYVDWVAVAPQARGRGVGSKLLAFADEVAQDRGLSAVALDVVDSNPRAQALYCRLGFDVESTRSVWPFRWLYQIRSYTRMVKKVGR